MKMPLPTPTDMDDFPVLCCCSRFRNGFRHYSFRTGPSWRTGRSCMTILLHIHFKLWKLIVTYHRQTNRHALRHQTALAPQVRLCSVGMRPSMLPASMATNSRATGPPKMHATMVSVTPARSDDYKLLLYVTT